MVFNLKIQASPARVGYARMIDLLIQGEFTALEIATIVERSEFMVRKDINLLRSFGRVYIPKWSGGVKPQPIFKLTLTPMPDAYAPGKSPEEKRAKAREEARRYAAERKKRLELLKTVIPKTGVVRTPSNILVKKGVPPVAGVAKTTEEKRRAHAMKALIVQRGGLVK